MNEERRLSNADREAIEYAIDRFFLRLGTLILLVRKQEKQDSKIREAGYASKDVDVEMESFLKELERKKYI